MKKTFFALAGMMVMAMAMGSSTAAFAFAAPPGDAMNPVNASQTTIEAKQAATLSTTQAPVSVQAVNPLAVVSSTHSEALAGRLCSSATCSGLFAEVAMNVTPRAGSPGHWRM
jgi:C4-dicarboxylate transporter